MNSKEKAKGKGKMEATNNNDNDNQSPIKTLSIKQISANQIYYRKFYAIKGIDMVFKFMENIKSNLLYLSPSEEDLLLELQKHQYYIKTFEELQYLHAYEEFVYQFVETHKNSNVFREDLSLIHISEPTRPY